MILFCSTNNSIIIIVKLNLNIKNIQNNLIICSGDRSIKLWIKKEKYK